MFVPINNWTKQKIKDQIVLKNNGHKSMALKTHVTKGSGGTMCAYRSQDGNACAAGCFIPDALYSLAMENTTIDNLMRESGTIADAMPLDIQGMKSLQQVHDQFETQYANVDYRHCNTVRDALLLWVDNSVGDSSVSSD